MLSVTMADEEEGEAWPHAVRAVPHGPRCLEGRAASFWNSKSMPDEVLTATAALRSFDRRLRKIFEGSGAALDRRRSWLPQGLSAISSAHYAELSKRSEIEVVPGLSSSSTIYSAISSFGSNAALEDVIGFFRYNVQPDPGSASVDDSLAEALGCAGKTEDGSSPRTRRPWRGPRRPGDPLLEGRRRLVATALVAVQPPRGRPVPVRNGRAQAPRLRSYARRIGAGPSLEVSPSGSRSVAPSSARSRPGGTARRGLISFQ